MKDNLLVAQSTKKTIIYIEKIVDNFPNTDRVLRDRIKGACYDILEYIYVANVSSESIREEYQNRVICKLKMIDFYFKLSLDKKYISYKKYTKIGNFLLSLTKQLYGWKNVKKSK